MKYLETSDLDRACIFVNSNINQWYLWRENSM